MLRRGSPRDNPRAEAGCFAYGIYRSLSISDRLIPCLVPSYPRYDVNAEYGVDSHTLWLYIRYCFQRLVNSDP